MVPHLWCAAHELRRLFVVNHVAGRRVGEHYVGGEAADGIALLALEC